MIKRNTLLKLLITQVVISYHPTITLPKTIFYKLDQSAQLPYQQFKFSSQSRLKSDVYHFIFSNCVNKFFFMNFLAVSLHSILE